jgi:hypothetical protein
MTDELPEGHDFKGLEPLKDAPVAPAHGIAAIALNMAMKWHDMSIVKDGQLYQQYKLEGRNIQNIDLADVFETAMKMERYLLGSSERIAKIVVDAIEIGLDESEAEHSPDDVSSTPVPSDQ